MFLITILVLMSYFSIYFYFKKLQLEQKLRKITKLKNIYGRELEERAKKKLISSIE